MRRRSNKTSNVFYQLNLIKYAVIVCVAVLIVWRISSWVMGVPMLEFFHKEYKMEKTATVLRSVQPLNQWVFLTVEDEQLVFRKDDEVAKIYKGTYELGIDLQDKEDWLDVQEVGDKTIANIELPPIKILHPDGIDDSEVMNIYGNAEADLKMEMRKQAEFKMKHRVLSKNNINQAEDMAKEHFYQMFRNLGCDSVHVKIKRYDYEGFY